MQRSLASTVWQSGDRSGPVAVVEFEGHGAHAAGDVDDARCAAGFEEERAEGLSDEVDACGVGVEVGQHVFASMFLGSDGCVVDQDIEAAVGGFDGFRSSGDAGVVGLIDL